MAHAVLVTLTRRRWGRQPELGPGYIAAALEAAGHSTIMLHVAPDDSASVARAASRVAEIAPQLIGIACSHAAVPVKTYRWVGNVILRALSSRPHLTTGGYFATFNADRLLKDWPELDSVVIGEGEGPAVALADRLRGRRPVDNVPGLRTRLGAFCPHPPLKSLDALPFPHRLYDGELEFPRLAAISTSRGCMAHCTFCNVPVWTRNHGGWRGRSASSVGWEVRALVDAGVRRLWIVDSSFEDPLPNGWKRMRELAGAIAGSFSAPTFYVFMRAETVADSTFEEILPDLVASGLRRVFVGAESSHDTLLHKMRKRAGTSSVRRAVNVLRQYGVALRVGFILFTPKATFETLRADVRFLAELSALHLTGDLCTRLELYVGAAEIARVRALGLLTGDPYADPFAYRFEDPRVGRLACRMGAVRDRPDLSDSWEALHDLELMLSGANHDSRVREIPDVAQACDELHHGCAQWKALMSEMNLEMFERACRWAEDEEPDIAFDEIERAWFDGGLTQVSEVARIEARAFAAYALSRGIDVRF
ncbi:MAG: cobalamin-dependent protein [bacterium]